MRNYLSFQSPPPVVFHGTEILFDAFDAFDAFDVEVCLGAHFGTEVSAVERLRTTGRLEIDFEVVEDDRGWLVLEALWVNVEPVEHGPFATEDDARSFIDFAPGNRTPRACSVEVCAPLELPDLGTWTFNALMAEMPKHPEVGIDLSACWSEWEQSDARGWAALRNAINRAGYDSIVYRNEVEDRGSLSWIVFDPARIRFVDALSHRTELSEESRRQRARG
jgi:hypothetical protein